MSKLMSLIRRAPKRTSAVIAILAAAIIVPAAVFAWGPNRATFTTKEPANYITFNSIVDNPAIGDERNFMQVREASASNETYADSISLTAGKEYVVFMYYHNNAKSNLNLVATGTYAKTELPAIVAKGSAGTKANGYIGASNANPTQVWDDISFKNSTAGDIALRYVPGSTTIHNFGATDGMTLPDTIATTGTPLGYNAIDGKVPGCNEFAGYVTFRVKADQANFNVSKQVRKSGTTTWSESVAVKHGDMVDYQIEYKNTGTTEQTDVVVKDVLPAGVQYVPGSTYVKNSANPNGKLINDDLVTSKGVNIGTYSPGANAFLKFSAKVTATDSQLKCGPNTLKNVATVYTKNGSKYDDANVTVDKECAPEVKYACKALGITQVNRTTFRFNTSYTAQNATFKSVTYVIKNAAGATVDTKTSTSTSLDYTQATAGKYTVQATVTFTVDGQDKTATSEACKGSFEVKEESKKIKVCELSTKKIVTIDEKDFDSSKYSKNLADCKETPPSKIKVCDLTTKQIVTIDEKDFDETKYSTDLSKCEETPVTPPELPKTGAGESIVAIVGLGALIASAAYYIASRRALNQ